ncbi:zinc ribbon domain-containing protein [Alkalibacillus aidingensis]|uniref:zinc ribbon domain-containing protein n=1 Tax=Alkalibacillus aidingensis TaxID=2747607 RepID=UPI0016607594|nr:zinc ribbon domain-containing protein [Alkalibacillus aidingensis]
MKCENCGNQLFIDDRFCSRCGAKVKQSSTYNHDQHQQTVVDQNPPREKKSVALAVILSLIIVGVGQIYLGQVLKGLVLLISSLLIGFVTVGLGAFVLWILVAIDAYKIANKINEGRTVDEWEFF